VSKTYKNTPVIINTKVTLANYYILQLQICCQI